MGVAATTSGGHHAASSAATVTLQGANLGTQTTHVDAERLEVKPGKDMSESHTASESHSLVWDIQKQDSDERTTYKPLELNTELSATLNSAHIQHKKGTPQPQIAFNDDADVIYEEVEDEHKTDHKTKKRLTAEARMAIQAFVTAAVCWAGPGGYLASAVGLESGAACTAVTAFGNSAVTSLASDFTANSIELGSIGKGFQETKKGKNLKATFRNAGLSAAMAVIPDAVVTEAGLTGDKITTFQKLSGAIIHDSVAVGLKTAFEGGDFWKNFIDYQKMSAINSIAAIAAEHIGDLKFDGMIDPFTHKVMHALVGGLTAELSGYDFASGALGAAVAETVAELVDELARPVVSDNDKPILSECADNVKKLRDQKGKPLTLKEINESNKATLKAIQNRKGAAAFAGKFAAISTAFAAGKNVGGASCAAVNAVENNYMGKVAKALPLLATTEGRALLAGIIGAINFAALGTLQELTDYFGGDEAKAREIFAQMKRDQVEAEKEEENLYARPDGNDYQHYDDVGRLVFELKAEEKRQNACARPEDKIDPKPLITPRPEPKMPDLVGTPKPEEKPQILVTPKPEGKGSILVTPKPEIKLEDLILTKQKGEDSSRIRPVNGRLSRNHQYAGQVYPVEKLLQDLQKKFPHSVPFKGSGFPDFTRYAIKKVKIEMTGTRRIDDDLANKVAGYKKHLKAILGTITMTERR